MINSTALTNEYVMPDGWSPMASLSDAAFFDAYGKEQEIMLMTNHGTITSGGKELIEKLLEGDWKYTWYVCWRRRNPLQPRFTIDIMDDEGLGYSVVWKEHSEHTHLVLASRIDELEDAERIQYIYVKQYKANAEARQARKESSNA